MDILIRRRDAGSDGETAAIERAVETDALGIGSAPDRDLRLADAAVAERHASISFADGTVQLVCRRGCSVLLDGVPLTRSALVPGSVLVIGGHRIEVTAPPTGFDLALDVSREASAGATGTAPPATFRGTRLADTWLAPRTMAWLLSLAVLLVGLAVPLARHALDARDRAPLGAVDAETRAGAAVAEAATGRPDEGGGRGDWLRRLGGDRLWNSGPLHDAHAALESDCGACHEKLFQRVTNASCERCHAGTVDHVTAGAAAANAHFPEPMNGRCAACHEEHNEPSTLVHASDALCADCHDDPALADADGPMTPVTAFGTGTHPDFEVTLPRPPADAVTKGTTSGIPNGVAAATVDEPTSGSTDRPTGADGWTFERRPLAGARESSGLRFDHAAHADGERMNRPDGKGLACADCHERNADGEHFAAIEFETDCASSGCHSLELDAGYRIPHGRADVAAAAIEGFYLRRFGDPEVARAAREPRRRRPDRGAPRVDERVDCDGSNFDCALALAERKVEQQFTRTGCVTCHLVEDARTASDVSAANGAESGATGEATPADASLVVPYAIAEVRLVEDVHPAARFDHASHDVLIEPGGDGVPVLGDAACGTCHAATTSTSAEDLLMPAIDTCTACHDGPSRTANVPLGCVDCHEYHPASSSLKAGRDS